MDQPDALLRWYDDETFFSLCCRQHLFLGHTDTASTLEWLFGSKKPISHDFPSNIRSLSSRMTAAWGHSKSTILEHTILPFFIPFQSQARIDAAVDAMESPAIGSLKFSLGLLTGRFGAEHPLKSCSICMNEDRASRGVAYWHLSHQYPGVVLCPAHDVLLKESAANRQWSGRFEWSLPSEDLFAPTQAVNPDDQTIEVLRQMGQAVLELVSYGKTDTLDPTIVHDVYKTVSGPVSQIDLAASLADRASQLQPYPPYNCLPTNPVDAGKFIAQLLRKPRGRQHPLKHLVLITCLFGQFSSFLESYSRISKEIRAKSVEINVLQGALKPKRNAGGHQITRKPKKLKSAVRAEILEALKFGQSKRQISSQFGVSVTTINRLLVSEPGIKEARVENLNAAELAKNRAIWMDSFQTGPLMSPKELRVKLPRVYAWLYRHDRIWLLDQNAQLPCGRRGNYSNIDWDKRDSDLRELIASTISQIHEQHEDTTLTRASIYSLIPNLSRLLEKRTRYPRSRQLLKEVVEQSKASKLGS